MESEQLPARDKILNAAEALFAQRGYHGVTLREITRLAGVDLALVNYYFGPKQALFHEVLNRRAAEHVAAIDRAIDAAVAAAAPRPPTVEAIIRSLAAPVVERLARGGPGWRNYIHLLSYLSNSQQQDFMAPMHGHFDPVMRRCFDLLRETLPACSEQSLYRSFHLVLGALTHVYAETGGIDRLSDGVSRADDFDAHLDHLVPFLAAGFYRMTAGATA